MIDLDGIYLAEALSWIY